MDASALQHFLATDPADVGCKEAMEVLHAYVDLVASGGDATTCYPGVVAHLRGCGPCGEDFAGLLAAVDGAAARVATLDPDSAEWLRALEGTEAEREAARLRLHAMLLRIARHEVRRRSDHLQIAGPELDDVAHQAAADAMVAILAKAGHFRGESRFTTWAYKFVIFEVSTKIGRHFWRNRTVAMDDEDWGRLPDRFGLDPADEAEWRDLVIALQQAVDDDLTDRQRQVFVAIVLNGVSLDALVVELGSNRNAIYKMVFDARRKLRAALVAKGLVDTESSASV